MLTNPYNPLGIHWQDNHMVVGRVSQEDFFFLKQKFPYYPGLVDKIISNLFKATIDELRRRNSETPIATALYIDDPSYRILDDVIASITRVERRSLGEHSPGGDSVTQHDTGAVDGVHSAVQRSEVELPVTKGRNPSRKRSAKGTTKKEK